MVVVPDAPATVARSAPGNCYFSGLDIMAPAKLDRALGELRSQQTK
jgi:hypothetical protein